MNKPKPFTSALLGGVTAAVIWMAITTGLQMTPAVVGFGGLGFLVVTFLVAYVLTVIIGRRMATATA